MEIIQIDGLMKWKTILMLSLIDIDTSF